MEMNINKNLSEPALLGDSMGKIKSFAVFHMESSINIDGDPNGLLWYLKNLSLPYALTEEQDTLIIYNPAFNDAIHIAVRFVLKSFFFVTNEFPAVITYYERLNPETYKKSDIMADITDPKSAEEFISGHADYDINFDMPYIADSAERVCRSIINENYPYHIERATDDSLTSRGRADARRHARRKDEQSENV